MNCSYLAFSIQLLGNETTVDAGAVFIKLEPFRLNLESLLGASIFEQFNDISVV